MWEPMETNCRVIHCDLLHHDRGLATPPLAHAQCRGIHHVGNWSNGNVRWSQGDWWDHRCIGPNICREYHTKSTLIGTIPLYYANAGNSSWIGAQWLKGHVSWQPIIFSASSHVHSSHVHSHMLHHMVSHLTGHMTHHMIYHMISRHNIGHVIWCHSLEGSRKVWNDDLELLLIHSSISHPMTLCAASWLILWCHAQPQQVINSIHSVITANCSSRYTQVQTVTRSIYTPL